MKLKTLLEQLYNGLLDLMLLKQRRKREKEQKKRL